jgi:hypothetical protein
MPSTPIDQFILEHYALTDFLEKEISFKLNVDREFRKVLVLSVASYFEAQLLESLKEMTKCCMNQPVAFFLDKKAISRQYHTYFQWQEKNINSFLGLFGDDFKKSMLNKIKQQQLEQNMNDFMALGRTRNQLVHDNFVIASLPDWTVEDIVEKYKSALKFVEFLTQEIINLSNPNLESSN